MNQIEAILHLSEVYGAARKVREATVSTLVFRDGKRLASLRSGCDLRLRTASSALLWFSDNWPDSAVWPADIVRPHVSETVAA
jgi:hypothetical protein